jgi:hypothetical protein
MGGAFSTYGGGVRLGVLVEKPDGKTQLGSPGRRWEDKIKLDLQEVEWGHGPN